MNLEESLLRLKDPKGCFYYCLAHADTANIEAHQKVILDSKNLYILIWFAKDIKNSNKQLLSEVVLASGDLFWIKRFYDEVDFDKSKYETLMLFL
jgi:hypothetical protein